MRGQCTQSLVKERMGSVSRPKVLQGSIILQQPNRVQLKKSIQQATYQNQMAQQTIDMANEQMIRSQNVGEAINITIASLTGLIGAQTKPSNGTNRYPNQTTTADDIHVGFKVMQTLGETYSAGLDNQASITQPSGQNSFCQQAPARV